MVTPLEILAAVLFVAALVHTFSTSFFERLSRRNTAHSGLWHLLAEVEVVFGFWAVILVLFLFAIRGKSEAVDYLNGLNFVEPVFVFAIMAVSGTRPVLEFARRCLDATARLLPVRQGVAYYFLLLSLAPLLGSLITEPAAMTLAALVLRDRFFSAGLSARLRYFTLGTLFVNVSIGGTLTPFAAPPVLMVAGAWGWDTWFMLGNFGWKAVVAVTVNALIAAMAFRGELCALPDALQKDGREAVPRALMAVNLLFLLGVVVFAHYPVIFLGLFLIFLGVAQAYERHYDQLMLREGLLVGFFLAGLVVLGGMQTWWLRPLLLSMSSDAVYFGATALTALTDNAALTYLGSLVQGLSPEFQYSLVAGAVTGGGLTIVANAPNPAGIAILRGHFEDRSVSAPCMLLAALAPTLVALAAFKLL